MKKKKQWEYIKRRYQNLNKLIESGKLVIQFKEDCEPEIINKTFDIVEKNKNGVPGIYYVPYDKTTFVKYEHDPEWDHGFYTPIEELDKELFDNIKIFEPVGTVVEF